MKMQGEVLAGRYRPLGETFSGRFLATYEAEDISLGTKVEIDVVSHCRDGFALPPARLKELLEVSLRMRGPHVYPLFAWWEDGGCFYVVRAQTRGTALAGLLRQTGNLPAVQVEEIVAAAVRVLCEAYGLGLYYLGLNPYQVFIESKGRVGIARAGYGWFVEEAEPALLERVSPYRAPETDGGHEGTRASDVFALAVMLGEMLPEEALTGRLRALLHTAREPVPQRRPSSPRLLLEELQAALGFEHAGSAARERPAFQYPQLRPEVDIPHDAASHRAWNLPRERGLDCGVNVPREQGPYRADGDTLGWDGFPDQDHPRGVRAFLGQGGTRERRFFRDADGCPEWGDYRTEGAARGARWEGGQESCLAAGNKVGRQIHGQVPSEHSAQVGFPAPERRKTPLRRRGILRMLAIMLAGGLVLWAIFAALAGILRGDSGGREKEKADKAVTVLLPDLQGMSEKEAIQALEELGLEYRVREAPSRLWSAGRVIAQEPAQGSSLPPGEVVNLVVSSGVDETAAAPAGESTLPTQGESDPTAALPGASAVDGSLSSPAEKAPLLGQGTAANRAPRAVARLSCRSGQAPLYVRMDGSGSYDPDGIIVRYLWHCGDGTVLEGMNAQHVFDSPVVPARFQVFLEVVDSEGARDTAEVTVEVY